MAALPWYDCDMVDGTLESTGSPGFDEMNVLLAAASTREEKHAVLLKYMSEDRAEHSIGLIMGEYDGDVYDRPEA